MFKRGSKHDASLPGVFTVTGKIDRKNFRDIVSKLCKTFPQFNSVKHEKTEIKKNLQFIRTFMTKGRRGVVKDSLNGKTYVNGKVRKCYQRTFGAETITQLRSNILPTLKSRMMRKNNTTNSIPVSCRIEPTHGDIIMYKRGGFFLPHRDQKLAGFPGYEMFTMLLCIDSNIPHDSFTEDGNTNVWLPTNTEPGKGIDFKQKELMKHSFTESRTPGFFLLFASQALHAGARINMPKKFKLCLKIDFWVKFETSKILMPIQSHIKICRCLYCDSYHVIHTTRSLIAMGFPKDLAFLTLEYVEHNEREECRCVDVYETGICVCTCAICTERGICPHVEAYRDELDQQAYQDHYDELDAWEERFCNGYESDGW